MKWIFYILLVAVVFMHMKPTSQATQSAAKLDLI